jgi:CheY-like chemotaxis protein/HPt (histidine-containing phosphotransfer) domain-containing protein
LLAEDVVVNQKFALLALEEMGYRADVAANGLETLAAVLRQPYDVILMDVQMPEMDGLEATRRIHEIWDHKDLPGFRRTQDSQNQEGLPTPQRPYIIAMTANALQGDREICLEAGMDDYISKPVYLEELRAALERAGRSRGAEEQSGRGASPFSPQRPVALAPSPLIDEAILEKLLKRPGGQEIITGYLAEAQEMINRLRRAIARGDASGVREAAHSLKGSSSYVGAQKVATLSSELEHRGLQKELNDAAAFLVQLEEEFEGLRQVLANTKKGEQP